ncbi:MAG TPA: tetratricopeptide repeat protein [Candidatus Cybelea sp.]|nr:tetratricopeptide repeat protein [Candidatus Cybelea sp.]
MRHSLLCAIALALVLTPGAPAQEQTPSGVPSASTAAEKLSPRQSAELRADILMARKEFVDAIRAYDEILKSDPKNAQILNKVGIAYEELPDLGRAERYFKKAMREDKTFASAINNLGTVEYMKKRYGKAADYYKKALELHTEMGAIYVNLGYAYLEDKKYPEAMTAFGNALKVDPSVFERKEGGGTIVQQRSTSDPGLFYFFIAKNYALAGDAEHAAHYLKMARDDGYKEFASAAKDPSFSKVIKDPRVQEVLTVVPSYAVDRHKMPGN